MLTFLATQISVQHEMNVPNIKLQHSSTSSAFRPIQNEKPTNGTDSVQQRLSFDKLSPDKRRRRRASESEVRRKST